MLPFEENKLPFEEDSKESSSPNGDKFYSGLADEALGVWDTAAGLLQGAVMGTLDPINALGKAAVGLVPDAEKEVNRLVRKNQFTPVSQAGERNLSAIGKVFNDVIIPIAPMAMPFAPRLPGLKPWSKTPREIAPVAKSLDEVMAEREAGKAPTETPRLPYEVDGQPWVENPQYKERAIAQQQMAATGRTDLDPTQGSNLPPVMRVDSSGQAYRPEFSTEVARDIALRKVEAERVKGMTNESQQTPMFDQPEQGYGANLYGAHMGDWRVDENGMPIRADLSLEAQNLENPLQRGLWGDELPPRVDPIGQAATLAEGVRQFDEQPVAGGIPLTDAIDSMDWAHRRGAIKNELTGAVEASGALEGAKMEANSPFRGMGKDQAGVINEKLLTWLPEKIIDLAKKLGENYKGITLHLQTSPYGPHLLLKRDGQDIGFIGTDVVEHKGEKKLKVANVGVSPVERGKGYGKLMYEVLAGLGNDIIRSDTQLPDGKAMWDHWEATGYSKDGQINAGMGKGQRGGLWMGGNKPSASEMTVKQADPRPDTVLEPRSEATIALRAEKRAKASALGLNQYDRIITAEEAKALIDPKADMLRAGVNGLRSGAEGALRTNIKNSLLNFQRTILQVARNEAETLSKRYITDNKTGIIRMAKNLSQEARNQVAGDLMWFSKNQREYDVSILRDAGRSQAQIDLVTRIWEALDHRLANVSEALGKQGLVVFEGRKGYFPSMFDGSFTSLVGHYKDGSWVTTGIAQADTRYGYNKAVEKYLTMGEEYSVVLPMERKGLNTSTSKGRPYDSFADVVRQLALIDPKFAEAKSIVDAHVADQVHALYRFDVHELKKKGIKGSLGDRPWLSQNENTKQLFEGLVNYLEEGFRYDSLLGPLTDLGKLIADPEVKAKMPNTVEFITQHTSKITGQNLNAFGAAGNLLVDTLPRALGVGTSYPRAAVNGLVSASTSLMMGFANLGFALMQLSQLPLSGSTEAMGVLGALKLSPKDAAGAVKNTMLHFPVLGVAKIFGMDSLTDHVPNHLKHAYDWAHEKGMFDYSEAELVHNLNKSDARVVVEKLVNSSISIPEKLTRPPMFMLMVDMFHRAGYYGEEGLLRAQAATDYAMVNYHPDESPGIYQALGQVGSGLGALSRYKHNFVEQQISRAVNAKEQPAPFLVSLALAYGVYGLTGQPGYEEVSWLVQKLSGKSIREWFLDDPTKPNKVMDGVASTISGTDYQARISMANLLPDPSKPMSAIPHVSNVLDITSAAMAYTMKQDEESLRNMKYKVLPSSMRNIYEDKVMTDEHGMVRDAGGDKKIETPRTEEEQTMRRRYGLRPIKERLDSETLYTRKQSEFEKTRKLAEIRNSFASQVRLGKPIGPMVEKYKELGGDPDVLFNQVDKIKEEALKTPKQRAEGTPGNSLSSLRKYDAYNP